VKAKVTLVKIWAVTACALTLGTIFFLFAYIFYHGAGAITWEFLTESPKGAVLGTKGGILPAIVGSAWYTGIASLFGAVLGMYIVLNLDVAVREALTFIKGWRSDK
jgi:phosphate transport system permease protein